MLWLFATFGLLIFIAAAFGFISTWRGESMLSALHFAALFLVCLAWVLGHESGRGWLALLAALFAEGGAWFRIVYAQARLGFQAAASVEPLETSPPVAQVPQPQPQPIARITPAPVEPLVVESIVLLESPWQASPEVFLASLRRGGQRDSRLLGSDGRARYEVAGIELELHATATTVSNDLVSHALDQTFDWPEAAQAVQSHKGIVRIQTRSAKTGSRLPIILLHIKAQKALLEFARVLAVLWPAAGRLYSRQSLAEMRPDNLVDPAAPCVTFRTFAIGSEQTLCDTEGLGGLGLLDLEMTIDGQPNDAVSTMLFELAEKQLASGLAPAEGESIKSEAGDYTVEIRESAFERKRPVAHLESLTRT